jgi:hypothetical protein
MTPRRVVGLLALVALPGATLLPVACSDPAYVYVARRYDPVRDCLLPSEGIDVVRGSGSSDCAAACLVDTRDAATTLSSYSDELADAADASDASDGGVIDPSTRLYVSTMCPPYPVGFDTSGTAPGCAAALEASHAGKSCGDGG